MTAMMDFQVQEPRAIANHPIAGELKDWLARHQPQLRDFHEDAENFGNLVMVLAKDGIEVRFAGDRGMLLVDVGLKGNWVPDRVIDAFLRSVPVDSGRSWPEFDPLSDSDAVRMALSSQELAAFQEGADVAALQAFGFPVATA